MSAQYDIFISYRRNGGFETSKHLYDLLIRDGYSVSFDVDTLRNGDFNTELLERIAHCKDFILVLDAHAFDRTLDKSYPKEKDWLRNELAYALSCGINIIPIMLSGFDAFPENLPEDIAGVATKNGPQYNKDYFDAFYARLTEFLSAKPYSKSKRQEHRPFNNSKVLKRGLLAIAALSLAASLLYYLPKQFKSRGTVLHFNDQSLSVNVEGLSDFQLLALQDILDHMVFVKEGAFSMGLQRDTLLTASDSTALPVHQVALSSYYISSREVTQTQWLAFSQPQDAIEIPGLDYPVDHMSWVQAKAFADTLSSITGLSFSLPTEAQWEYAARGGILSRHFIYSGADSPSEVAWLMTSSKSGISSVAKLKPNELGLYDMTGNVDEWCWDYFAPYDSTLLINPEGPLKGSTRVFRGGSVYTLPYEAKLSVRHHYMPDFQRQATGMRLVINIK